MALSTQTANTIKQIIRVLRPVLIVLSLYLKKTEQINQTQFFIILAVVLFLGVIVESYITIQTNPEVTLSIQLKNIFIRILPILGAAAIIFLLYQFDFFSSFKM